MPDASQLIRLAAEVLVSGILWVILTFLPEAWNDRARDRRSLPLLLAGAVVTSIIFYYLIVQRWPFAG